jgi:hypothetical protein
VDDYEINTQEGSSKKNTMPKTIQSDVLLYQFQHNQPLGLGNKPLLRAAK